MSSPEQCYDEFCFPMDSPPGKNFEEFVEKQDANSGSSPTSSEGNNVGFEEFVDEDTSRDSETQRTMHSLVDDLYVSGSDQVKIQKEKESLLKLACPPKTAGRPLLGCPFVVKLYVAAGSDAFTMLNWSPDGRQLEVEYRTLQNYLTAGGGIFRFRSVKQFTEKLKTEGFLRIQQAERVPLVRGPCNLKPMLLYYHQPQFVRGELDSLRKLMQESLLIEKYYPMGAQYGGETAEDEEKKQEFPVRLHMQSRSHLERMRQRGDKCCSITSVRSPLQAARCRFRTLLDHLVTTKVLEDSAEPCKKASMKKGARPWDCPSFTSASIKFLRPHDSVISLDASKPLPEYAGYYGQMSPSKVNKFFGDYLPRYGNKTTGYKEIVVETTHKSTSFQQNLPIGLVSSEGEDDDPDDAPPPVSPAGQDSDMDFMPSTSAAAALRSSGRKISADSVDDQDLEEAMQELCGGSTALKQNVSAGSRGRPKAQQQPNATEGFDSNSSENEAAGPPHVKRVVKSIQEEAIEDNKNNSPPKRRGRKAKAKTPKVTARKRFASPNLNEASPPRKRAQRDSRKRKQPEEELEEEEILVKKKRGQTKKQETDEENEYEEGETIEYTIKEGAEDAEEDEYVEEIVEEYEQPEGYEQPEEGEQPEYQAIEEEEYPQEEHREGEYLKEEQTEGQYPGEYPEGEYQEGEYQEGQYPEGEYQEGQYQGEYPDGEYPEGEYQEGQYPEGEYPEGEYQEGEYQEGKYPEEEYQEGQYPEGEYKEGQYQEGEYPEGEQPEEQYPKREYPEGEYPEGEYPEGENSEGEYPAEEYQPEEDQSEEEKAEEGQLKTEYSEEDEQPEEDTNEDETQEAEGDEDNEEDLEGEEEDAEEDEDEEEDEDDEEDEDPEEDDDDDDDDDDYSVQYRAAPQEQDKPRRYDLRNSMRKSN